jgi:phage-related baseplate assembly protein
MADLNFINTDSAEIHRTIIEGLENGVAEPLYPGDERRIFGEALVPLFVAMYSAVNDAAKQKMLRYARGEVLDAIGERASITRLVPVPAKTTIRFSVNSSIDTNIIIPMGTRVTSDFVLYFKTDVAAVLSAGELYVDVKASSVDGGTAYNELTPGEINTLVDMVPYIDTVRNTETTYGGSDNEDDDSLRDRIRLSSAVPSTAGPVNAYKYWAKSADPTIADVAVQSEKETIARTLPVSAGKAYKGGSYLLADSLKVYASGNSNPATAGTDYTATYEDELLTITMTPDGALEATTEIDIEIDQTMDGRVKIVPICLGGVIPSQGILDKVLVACSADDVRPLTDHVAVEAPSVQNYDIELKYYTTAADESKVIETIEGDGGAISRYNSWQCSVLGRDINPDQLRKLILAPSWDSDNLVGAIRVDVTAPVFTELPDTSVAKFSGNLTVTHEVVEE